MGGSNSSDCAKNPLDNGVCISSKVRLPDPNDSISNCLAIGVLGSIERHPLDLATIQRTRRLAGGIAVPVVAVKLDHQGCSGNERVDAELPVDDVLRQVLHRCDVQFPIGIDLERRSTAVVEVGLRDRDSRAVSGIRVTATDRAVATPSLFHPRRGSPDGRSANRTDIGQLVSSLPGVETPPGTKPRFLGAVSCRLIIAATKLAGLGYLISPGQAGTRAGAVRPPSTSEPRTVWLLALLAFLLWIAKGDASASTTAETGWLPTGSRSAIERNPALLTGMKDALSPAATRTEVTGRQDLPFPTEDRRATCDAGSRRHAFQVYDAPLFAFMERKA